MIFQGQFELIDLRLQMSGGKYFRHVQDDTIQFEIFVSKKRISNYAVIKKVTNKNIPSVVKVKDK